MRILTLGWELPPRFAGGVGIVAEALLRAISTRGHQLTYAMPHPEGAVGPPGVRILGTGCLAGVTRASGLVSYAGEAPPIRIPGEAPPPSGAPLYGPDLLREVERFADQVVAGVARQGIDFDLIHAHDWTTFRAGLALRRATGRPLVAHVHITEFDKSGGSYADPGVYALEREGFHGADRLIAVSRRIANTCSRRYGVDAARIRVVHNGAEAAGGMPEALSLPRPLVLFLGRITLQKGPEYFLEAARRVLEVVPDAHFAMAGTGDLLPRMIERAAEQGIASRVFFPGFVDREGAAALYAAADVFVMPSVSEPFGIVPLEAMHHGVPVIVSRESGVAELLHNALKCDPWDVERMASLIAAALRYPALSRALEEHGREEAARCDWAAVAARVESVYREIAVA